MGDLTPGEQLLKAIFAAPEPEAAEPILCPECEQGKTVNCVGVALDFERDEFVPCETARSVT